MRATAAEPRHSPTPSPVTHPVVAALHVHLKQARVYGQDFLLRLATYPVLLLITLALWRAIHHASSDLGVSLGYILTYYALTLALTRLVPFGTTTSTLADQIYSGDLAVALARPVRLWWLPFAELAANATIALAIVSPLAIVGLLVSHAALATVLSFLAAFFLSTYLQFWFFYLLGALAFWMENIRGIVYGTSLALSLLTGALIPLRFFPHVVEQILNLTPFPYFLYYPVDLLLSANHLSLQPLAVMVAWSVLLTLTANLVFREGLKRFTAHGV